MRDVLLDLMSDDCRQSFCFHPGAFNGFKMNAHVTLHPELYPDRIAIQRTFFGVLGANRDDKVH